ncbi:MAG: hypothetical protein PF483_12840 [Halothiobacillus sp.]|jgi:hypothetical protein|nr:hypothetical protein [Halothiobacillus sp.]
MARLLIREQRIGLSLWADLFSVEECQALIGIGQHLLAPATVTTEENSQETPHPDRVSDMAEPKQEEHPLLQHLAEGIERFTGISKACQEPLLILHYLPGGEYKPQSRNWTSRSHHWPAPG